MSNWHNQLHEEEGWFNEFRQKKIERGDICGGCGEWPNYCGCKTTCKASISGLCLAVTHNLPYCEPECESTDQSECDKMDGEAYSIRVCQHEECWQGCKYNPLCQGEGD